jgi:transglutaminase-like putative cysteine protease
MQKLDNTWAPFLTPTAIVNSDHPTVLAYAAQHVVGIEDLTARAIALYYAIRDGIRYDGYVLELTPRGLSASHALEIGRGWCVSKAVLLAACCRASGVPARLGYADVKNHLSTARMREQMGTDEFYWHGYTDIYLKGQWVKATPAFNIELCQKFRLKPLEFDGTADSIYHPFDEDGRQHMEYLRYRGEFADVPLAEIKKTFAEKYPHLAKLRAGDFDHEVEVETKRG